MDVKFTQLTPELYAYLLAHRAPRDPVLEALAAETAELGGVSIMQIAAEQGAFMTMLARVIGARQAIEVGTFTGYGALCLARGLPADGRLVACDVSEEWAAVARRHWADAGLGERIDLRIGPALDTLQSLPLAPVFDLAFIDADKVNYRAYYEEILPRVRSNGLILFDNVFWFGMVVNAEAQDDDTRALRELNDCIVADERVESVMLPIADGLTIVRKR